MLDSLPLPKYVFTNADRAHAKRCLDLLGITECFIRVISFEEVMEAAAEVGRARGGGVGYERSRLSWRGYDGSDSDVTPFRLLPTCSLTLLPLSSRHQAGLTHHGCPVVCKPNRQAFDIALQLAGSPTPGATLWADDSARNITTGHRMGLYSVLVGRTGGCADRSWGGIGGAKRDWRAPLCWTHASGRRWTLLQHLTPFLPACLLSNHMQEWPAPQTSRSVTSMSCPLRCPGCGRASSRPCARRRRCRMQTAQEQQTRVHLATAAQQCRPRQQARLQPAAGAARTRR